MFWNVENLFDPFDDSLTLDDEFTSRGDHNWTWERFNQKMNHVYKVMISAGWEPQDIIGLCEVENRWVLERLTRMTPLSKYEYRIIHQNSPDIRGIDVAMLYHPDSFIPIETAFITVTGLKNDDDPTRDILFVKGVLRSQDTVNIFVNHWPSRYPGQVETIHKRQAAAADLKRQTDSLIKADPESKIIIMGDFNDEPLDESISEVLEVKFLQDELPWNKLSEYELSETELPGLEKIVHINKNDTAKSRQSGDKIIRNHLYSLIPPFNKSITGTLKFEGRWYLFDQFIISGGLFKEISSYKTVIMSHDFLLEPDEAYTGQKPFRTYNGYIYRGGYSDHLPVLLELRFDPW
jgi:endonuclease/exonuclease/phosphatase family metal-dependent hydrolase